MEQTNKAHRQSGERNTAKKKLHQGGHNAKAFAFNAPMKLQRAAMRTNDVNEKKLHVPMVDRTPDQDPPPVIVAVVGPPGTGKTTLIKSLIKRLAKTNLNDINGPVTLVSGKRRRLTIIEVGNDLNSMVDAAKIADLVLLMIDGNFGLEMETMEFLNVAQHHGMPRMLGVCTHLDLFKSQSTLRSSKKRLKTRFWTEVYQGAKLFYLSGVINGRYPDREILNLTRFISVMKFRPLKWRNEHPYMLADRVTDLTHPTLIEQNPNCDRKIAIYGYLHGTPMAQANARVHIAGVGDYTVHSAERLPDPCPTPYYEQKLEEIEREAAKAAAAAGEAVVKTKTRRKRLEDKQRIIYAPMSDVGGVLVDRDAVYIDMGETESFVPGEERGFGEKLVTGLQEVTKSMEEMFDEGPGLRLFSESKELGSKTLAPEDSDDEAGLLSELESEEEEEDDVARVNTGRTSMRQARVVGKPLNEEEDNDMDSDDFNDEEEESRAKTEVVDFGGQEELAYASDSDLGDDDFVGAATRLRGSAQRKWNLSKLIYTEGLEPGEALRKWKQEEEEEEENIEDDEDDFFQKKETAASNADLDTFVPFFDDLQTLKEKFTTEAIEALKSRFFAVSKKPSGEASDDEIFGDFEDLETGESKKETSSSDSDADSNADSDDFADFDAEEKKEEEEEEEEEVDQTLTVDEKRALNAKKKEKLRLQFEAEQGDTFGEDEGEYDTWYELQKAKMAKQLEINKAEFEAMDGSTRERIEGILAGSYVRLVFNDVPPEFIENFNPKYPVVIGGLLATEERFGYLNVRIRRHRWHKKILKSNDPLILSLGWRRFQTLPVYTTSDSRTRNRMLKYTPEHAYCTATLYGPLVSPNTTFCGFQVVANSDTTGSFRVAATGIVEDLNSSVEIVKKLKLVGYPYKVYKNTAFIKDMFSTSLEVAKFEGASIKTVSGVRGEIKRALSKPEGHYRATFEDKILLSDIVMLRTWYPVAVKKFYNPVSSLLLSDKADWKGMRLTGAIRAANAIATPSNPNSAYGKIERAERRFNPLRVPKAIQSDLPFKSQISAMKPQKKQSYMAKRAVVLGGDEKKARELLQKVATVRKLKDEKRKAKKGEKFQEKLKKMAKMADIRTEKEKERKKEFFAKEGKKRSMGSSEGNSEAFGKKRRAY
ncbi:hypothetical protein BABINDRAFT_64988 [Babjeviella inositovora NRRL Y-12698]|uniref:Bms1-type G domain-containing protein n=1 Tax=Babjeviella inositovora NRRL Y-12698 TaxID=984486 RepID=A0A1E3QLR0_9ASCO|nr:uncharacterized protein BABINDRAFT_64988 [Babjeviella inositovora NRRL Y-12698]ODQ78404.1 hypothetical protein BABINDRAFT_64988 [Babjeviella inositovora NRRL Y-12698]